MDVYVETIVLHRKLYGFQKNHKHERHTLLVNHFILEKVGKQYILFSLLIKTKKKWLLLLCRCQMLNTAVGTQQVPGHAGWLKAEGAERRYKTNARLTSGSEKM